MTVPLKNTNDSRPKAQARINPRHLAAEFLGTALLLATVVGSGIMGVELAQGNTALALLANSLATGLMLIVLILCFAPISGAHFNPIVTLTALLDKTLSSQAAWLTVLVQVLGALAGVLLAHAMFAVPLALSAHERTGAAQVFSEAVATFGLLLVIQMGKRYGTAMTAALVAAYITAAYWFTASTSFANPAVTLARAFTDTFCGIHIAGVLPFVGAQILGGLAAVWVFRWFKRGDLS